MPTNVEIFQMEMLLKPQLYNFLFFQIILWLSNANKTVIYNIQAKGDFLLLQCFLSKVERGTV